MINLLFSLLLLSSPSLADSYNRDCANRAKALVETALVENTFGTAIDSHSIEKVILETFENTTPGSYHQEYEMIFQVVFNAGSMAQKSKDGFAIFYSAFICDNLKITSLELQ